MKSAEDVLNEATEDMNQYQAGGVYIDLHINYIYIHVQLYIYIYIYCSIFTTNIHQQQWVKS